MHGLHAGATPRIRGRGRGAAFRPRGRPAADDPAAAEPPDPETRARRRRPAARAGQPPGRADPGRRGVPRRGAPMLASGRRRRPSSPGGSPGSRGPVRIGFTAASTFGTLGRLLDELGRKFPDVRRRVSRDGHPGTGRRARRGDLDLGLARPPFDADAVRSRLLHREALLLAVPAEHRLAAAGRAARGRPRRGAGDHALADAGPLLLRPGRQHGAVARERVVHSVSQVLTMLWLVAAGRGIAFVPASAALLGIPGVVFVAWTRRCRSRSSCTCSGRGTRGTPRWGGCSPLSIQQRYRLMRKHSWTRAE